ncbi:ribbon-helix-helix protein, CopG family [Lachnospiraceae bacterium 56-18]|uniref:plasmid mobilization protein n=1 Tax=Sporofaciens sp. JLR.KK001 TaxID=3112621 RepID=UPI002FF02523
MARGTGTKGKKVTVRLTEDEYDRLNSEANNNHISISEHIRKKLENKIQNTELLVQLCNYSTSLNKILNKYDIAQEDKDFLNQEARLVWQHLK